MSGVSTCLRRKELEDWTAEVRAANLDFARRFPGESELRQPVHTVYGGAHLFKAEAAEKLGAVALSAWRTYAPDPSAMVRILKLEERWRAAGLDRERTDALAGDIHDRVTRKLQREPIEDFRIDFEDGFGNRPDPEEDFHAARTAVEMARGMERNCLPPFVGIRIKPFSGELISRSLRTLDVFLTTLTRNTGRRLPENFVVTLPKIPVPRHVACLAAVLGTLEDRLSLPEGSLRMEMMIELSQGMLDDRGACNLPLFLDAALGRCVAAHFGTYDYTASCNITAAHQEMTHPSCDFAKLLMQVAFAGTGVWLSDGATNVLPVPPHREGSEGGLDPRRREENRRVMENAWRLHVEHIFHSLRGGFYQGWDLHPNQLPTRYAAVYAFFLENLEAAAERLRNFIDKAAQATLVGDVFDDAATGQGLLNYFLRGLNCGAITEDEALATGLTLEELRTRSFVKILGARRERER